MSRRTTEQVKVKKGWRALATYKKKKECHYKSAKLIPGILPAYLIPLSLTHLDKYAKVEICRIKETGLNQAQKKQH